MVNKAISDLDDTYDVVVTHQDLTDRAQQKTPSAIHVSVDNFMGSPRYDEIVELITQSSAGAGHTARPRPPRASRATCWRRARSSWAARPRTATPRSRRPVTCWWTPAPSTRRTSPPCTSGRSRCPRFMGNGLAIPHGTNEAKGAIRRTAISFVRYDLPVDWNGKPAEFVIGIAGAGDDHLALLARIAETFVDADRVAELRAATLTGRRAGGPAGRPRLGHAPARSRAPTTRAGARLPQARGLGRLRRHTRSWRKAKSARCSAAPPGVSQITGAPASRTTAASRSGSIRPAPKLACRSAPESNSSRLSLAVDQVDAAGHLEDVLDHGLERVAARVGVAGVEAEPDHVGRPRPRRSASKTRSIRSR